MTASLEDTLISVWRQALVDDDRAVVLESGTYPVRRTSRSKLREVDFQFEDQMLRGLEQNPNTKSRWAQLARDACTNSRAESTIAKSSRTGLRNRYPSRIPLSKMCHWQKPSQ